MGDRDGGVDDRLDRLPSRLRGRTAWWLLVVGNRTFVAGGLLAVAFVALVGLELSPLVTVRRTQPLFYLFSALLGGNFTLITVVLSINQLVLSRELGAPHELREQIDGVEAYRRQVAAAADLQTTPIQPPAFLDLLLDLTRRRVQLLDHYVAGLGENDLRREVDELVATITTDTESAQALVQQPNVSTFRAIASTLIANYGQRIHRARQIQKRHRDALSQEAFDALEDLVTQLEQLDIARQYFKTVFIQKELAFLSRVLLYVGVPALFASGTALIWFASSVSGNVSGLPFFHPFAIPAAVVVSLAPFAVLFSFVLRIAVVAEKTATIIPFTSPEDVP